MHEDMRNFLYSLFWKIRCAYTYENIDQFLSEITNGLNFPNPTKDIELIAVHVWNDFKKEASLLHNQQKTLH